MLKYKYSEEEVIVSIFKCRKFIDLLRFNTFLIARKRTFI
jgi:hypothetical protein